MIEPTDTDCAYLAGIIDGEGCISGYIGYFRNNTPAHPKKRNDRVFVLYVSVVNTDRRMVDWVAARWHGSTHTRKPGSGGHKPVHSWMVQNSRGVRAVVEAALPYLVIKREQADLALQLAAMTRNPGRAGYSPAEVAARKGIYEQLRILNRKGPHDRPAGGGDAVPGYGAGV